MFKIYGHMFGGAANAGVNVAKTSVEHVKFGAAFTSKVVSGLALRATAPLRKPSPLVVRLFLPAWAVQHAKQQAEILTGLSRDKKINLHSIPRLALNVTATTNALSKCIAEGRQPPFPFTGEICDMATANYIIAGIQIVYAGYLLSQDCNSATCLVTVDSQISFPNTTLNAFPNILAEAEMVVEVREQDRAEHDLKFGEYPAQLEGDVPTSSYDKTIQGPHPGPATYGKVTWDCVGNAHADVIPKHTLVEVGGRMWQHKVKIAHKDEAIAEATLLVNNKLFTGAWQYGPDLSGQRNFMSTKNPASTRSGACRHYEHFPEFQDFDPNEAVGPIAGHCYDLVDARMIELITHMGVTHRDNVPTPHGHGARWEEELDVAFFKGAGKGILVPFNNDKHFYEYLDEQSKSVDNVCKAGETVDLKTGDASSTRKDGKGAYQRFVVNVGLTSQAENKPMMFPFAELLAHVAPGNCEKGQSQASYVKKQEALLECYSDVAYTSPTHTKSRAKTTALPKDTDFWSKHMTTLCPERQSIVRELRRLIYPENEDKSAADSRVTPWLLSRFATCLEDIHFKLHGSYPLACGYNADEGRDYSVRSKYSVIRYSTHLAYLHSGESFTNLIHWYNGMAEEMMIEALLHKDPDRQRTAAAAVLDALVPKLSDQDFAPRSESPLDAVDHQDVKRHIQKQIRSLSQSNCVLAFCQHSGDDKNVGFDAAAYAAHTSNRQMISFVKEHNKWVADEKLLQLYDKHRSSTLAKLCQKSTNTFHPKRAQYPNGDVINEMLSMYTIAIRTTGEFFSMVKDGKNMGKIAMTSAQIQMVVDDQGCGVIVTQFALAQLVTALGARLENQYDTIVSGGFTYGLLCFYAKELDEEHLSGALQYQKRDPQLRLAYDHVTDTMKPLPYKSIREMISKVSTKLTCARAKSGRVNANKMKLTMEFKDEVAAFTASRTTKDHGRGCPMRRWLEEIDDYFTNYFELVETDVDSPDRILGETDWGPFVHIWASSFLKRSKHWKHHVHPDQYDPKNDSVHEDWYGPMRSRVKTKGPVCYTCGEIGHKQADCLQAWE